MLAFIPPLSFEAPNMSKEYVSSLKPCLCGSKYDRTLDETLHEINPLTMT